MEAALENAAPDFELDLSRAVGPLHDVYDRDQMQELWREWAGSWESLRFEAGEFTEVGEQVVVPWTMYARGRDGIEVPSRVTWMWTIRDGAIARACMYQQHEDALEAAGLRGQTS